MPECIKRQEFPVMWGRVSEAERRFRATYNLIPKALLSDIY